MYVCTSVNVFAWERHHTVNRDRTVNSASFWGIPPADDVENQNPAGLSHTPVQAQLKKQNNNVQSVQMILWYSAVSYNVMWPVLNTIKGYLKV